MSQPRNGLPDGPLVIFVHMASVWVPFTSESKEAIADYDEIRKEIKLAIQECGRKLMTFIRKRQRIAREGQRRGIFEQYIGEVVTAVSKISGLGDRKQKDLYAIMMETAKKQHLPGRCRTRRGRQSAPARRQTAAGRKTRRRRKHRHPRNRRPDGNRSRRARGGESIALKIHRPRSTRPL